MKEQKWVPKNNNLPRNKQKNNLQIKTGGTQEDNDADSEDESPNENVKPQQDVSKSVRFVVDEGETGQDLDSGYQQLPEKPQSDDTDEAVPVASNISMNL